MRDFVDNLFSSGQFMSHGHCYLWDPGLVRLHLFSDLSIGIAYVAISLVLVHLVYRARRDVPFHWMLGGTLAGRSLPDQGTVVEARIPLPAEEPQAPIV